MNLLHAHRLAQDSHAHLCEESSVGKATKHPHPNWALTTCACIRATPTAPYLAPTQKVRVESQKMNSSRPLLHPTLFTPPTPLRPLLPRAEREKAPTRWLAGSPTRHRAELAPPSPVPPTVATEARDLVAEGCAA
jgi:hypothetical protein